MTNDSDNSIAFIRQYLKEIAYFKYLFIICIALFLIAAYLFNKYATRLYEVKASIGPVQNDASSLLSSNDLFVGLRALQSKNPVENGMNTLLSFPTISATITNMNLEIEYFKENSHLFSQTNELYLNSPFSIVMDKSHIQPIDVKIRIIILSDTTFRLYASESKVSFYNYLDNKVVSENNNLEIDTICRFNETIATPQYKFSVSFNRKSFLGQTNVEDLYFFKFSHLDFLTEKYMKSMSIEALSPKAPILILKFRGHNIEKSVRFLNTYIESALEENLAKKNRIAKSTINFIDRQISDISDSLVESQSNLRDYRSANQVMDLSFQGKSLYEKNTQIEIERNDLENQSRYYTYIINSFRNNSDMSGVVPPSARNVADPIMNQLITELLTLYTQRSGIVSNNSEKNLFIGQIDNKIRVQKQQIIDNATSNLNTLKLSLNELNYRSNRLSNEIYQIPKTELNMVGLQRKFDLSDVIHTYLLQKRSEAAITMASNYPDYEVIEPARQFTKRIIIPRTKISYLIALFLGFMLPTSFILLRSYFNNKIRGVDEIEYLMQRSGVGVIYNNSNKNELVVTESPRSAISESFRRLRSSLFLKLKDETSKVILVTSSQPKDGKSFVSLNLAASIASVGYKTIIIDCDLHKPTLHIKLNENNSSGVSSFMVKEAKLHDIIRKTTVENLSFIPAGPIVPNPSELIESGELDEMIRPLKEEYEFIIIDTSPVGLVVDALQLIRYASQILLISRVNYTNKEILSSVIKDFNLNRINNYDVILNNLSLSTSPYKNYTSYYTRK